MSFGDGSMRARGVPSALAAQIGASASNFLLVIDVIRHADFTRVGQFSLAYGATTFIGAMMRASMADTLIVERSLDANEKRHIAAAAIRFMVLGLIPVSLVGFAVFLRFGEPFIVLTGICLLPAVEAGRSLLVAFGRPVRAMVIEIGRMFVQLLLFVTGTLFSVRLSTIIEIWLAALFASIAVQAIILPTGSFRSFFRWFMYRRRLALAFSADVGLQTGVTVAADFLLAGLAAAQTLGLIRTASAPMNVVAVGMQAIGVALLPRIAGIPHQGRRLERARNLVSASVGSAAALAIGVLWLIPDALSARILGPGWSSARHLVPLIGLGVVGWAVASGPHLVARGIGHGRAIVRFRMAVSPLQLAGPVIGATFAGARGAAASFAVVGLVAGTLSFVMLGRGDGRRHSISDVRVKSSAILRRKSRLGS